MEATEGNRPERIAVVGAGAIGGYYGALLAAAGADVHFLLRSDYEAVTRHGFRIERDGEEPQTVRVHGYLRTAEIGPVDLVIMAAKATHNEALAPQLEPLLHAETRLLTLQNGLGNLEFFAARYGAGRMLGGLCFICLNRTAPGVIWNPYPGYLSLGRLAGPPDAFTEGVAAMFTEAGVKTRLSPSLEEALWRKLVWNVPFNGLAIAGGGITTDQILAHTGLRANARGLMEEIVAAAAAHGHAIEEAFVERQFRVTEPMGSYRPSSLIDFQEGRAVEVEAIWGVPLRRGEAKGVAMPRLALLHALISKLTEV